MDIINLKSNNEFFEGFDDPFGKEIIIKLKKDPIYNMHIWDGYFDDIFGIPIFSENDWVGFTKDYHENSRTFEADGFVEIDVDEYLSDLKRYLTKSFKFEESLDCLKTMILLLEYAKDMDSAVLVSVI